MTHVTRPAADLGNRTLRAIDALDTMRIRFPGGPAVPGGRMTLFQQWIYEESDIVANCPAGEWKKVRGAIPQLGLSHFSLEGRYTRASELRAHARAEGPEFIDGYGLVDRTGVTAADLTLSGSAQRVALSIWGGAGSDYHYSNDVMANVMVPADFSDHSKADGVERTDANWAASNAGALACGFGEALYKWIADPVLSLGPALDASRWQTGHVGEGSVSIWPRSHSATSGSPEGYNLIGGFNERIGTHWAPQAIVNYTGGNGFSWPEFFRNCDDGTTILSAKLRMKFSDVTYYRSTVTQASGSASPVTDESEESYPLSVAIMGRRRIGTAYQWDILGSVGGSSVVSDKWIMVDATNIFNMLLSQRGGIYDALCFFPSPAIPAYESLGNSGFLLALMPTFSLGYDYDPSNTTGFEGGSEGAFIAESSGSYIQWGDVGIDYGAVTIQIPESVGTEHIEFTNLPRMS